MAKKNGNGHRNAPADDLVGFLERSCLEAAHEARGIAAKKAFTSLGFAVGQGLRRSPGWLADFEHAVNVAHAGKKGKN